MALTKKNVIIKCKKILKELNINYQFVKTKRFGGGKTFFRPNFIIVNISKRMPSYDIAAVVMHEISHILCYQNSIYPIFHDVIRPFPKTKKEKIKYYRGYLNTALKGERHVDKMGNRLFNYYFKGYHYRKSYQSQSDIKFLNNNIKWARQKLDKLLK